MLPRQLTCLTMLICCGCSGLGKAPHFSRTERDGLRLKAIDQQTQAEACRRTAMELAAHEKDEHAIAQFEHAQDLNPKLKGIAHPLAVLYDRQGRVDAARRAYEQAIAESPRNADIRSDFGYFLYSQQDFANAQTELRSALRLRPNHPKAGVNLAMVFAAQEQYDDAFTQFAKSLGSAAAHHNIALLQLRTGNVEAATSHLEQASSIDPSLQSSELLVALTRQISSDQKIIVPASHSELRSN